MTPVRVHMDGSRCSLPDARCERCANPIVLAPIATPLRDRLPRRPVIGSSVQWRNEFESICGKLVRVIVAPDLADKTREIIGEFYEGVEIEVAADAPPGYFLFVGDGRIA